jgi:hypothetical protein
LPIRLAPGFGGLVGQPRRRFNLLNYLAIFALKSLARPSRRGW